MQLFLIPLLPIRPCAFDPNLREAGTQKGLLLLTRLPSSALKWTSVFAAKGFQRYFRFLFFLSCVFVLQKEWAFGDQSRVSKRAICINERTFTKDGEKRRKETSRRLHNGEPFWISV